MGGCIRVQWAQGGPKGGELVQGQLQAVGREGVMVQLSFISDMALEDSLPVQPGLP